MTITFTVSRREISEEGLRGYLLLDRLNRLNGRCSPTHPAVEDILRDSRVTVVPQSRASFRSGLDLYHARPEKGYSLTDCISMQTMRRIDRGSH
jgi:predicted nucleic acid-binding protein